MRVTSAAVLELCGIFRECHFRPRNVALARSSFAEMATATTPFPSLAHGLATLDAFPIAGALQIAPDQPGVDFDALERARTVLVQAWRGDLAPDEISVTAQGGVTISWRRSGWALELIVDPYALSAFRLDSPSKMVEWTRAGADATVADAKAALAAMAGDNAGSGRRQQQASA
jgi:hypothetical protein